MGAKDAASWPRRCKREIRNRLEQLQSGPEKSPTPSVDLFPVLCAALSFSKIFMLCPKKKKKKRKMHPYRKDRDPRKRWRDERETRKESKEE